MKNRWEEQHAKMQETIQYLEGRVARLENPQQQQQDNRSVVSNPSCSLSVASLLSCILIYALFIA